MSYQAVPVETIVQHLPQFRESVFQQVCRWAQHCGADEIWFDDVTRCLVIRKVQP